MDATPRELPRLLTARELADRFRSLSLARIHRLTRQGVIPHIRLGRSIRYSETTIAEWLERGGK